MEDECSHPVQLRGLCAICGADVSFLIEREQLEPSSESGKNPPTAMFHHILHGNLDLRVSFKEAERIELESQTRLLAEKKLSLVIDLDQTILHATIDPLVKEWIENPHHPNHPFVKDIARVILPDSDHIYYIKFRPLLHQFLQELSRLFEFHIYTMGSQTYAKEVVKRIDPDGYWFGDRILSRELAGIPENRKELKRIFPCDDRTVLVIDDRADVWDYSGNLVQVSPYNFFIGAGDVHSPIADRPLKRFEDCDEAEGVEQTILDPIIHDGDTELILIQQILESLHKKFFERYEREAANGTMPDVKMLLRERRKSILPNAHLAFSGIIPLGQAQNQSSLWLLAEAIGAKCYESLSDNLTHLISTRLDTGKAVEASKRGIKIISPAWLEACWKSWKCVPESRYLLSKGAFEDSTINANLKGIKNTVNTAKHSIEGMKSVENDKGAKSVGNIESMQSLENTKNMQSVDHVSAEFGERLAFDSQDLYELDQEIENCLNDSTENDSNGDADEYGQDNDTNDSYDFNNGQSSTTYPVDQSLGVKRKATSVSESYSSSQSNGSLERYLDQEL